MVLYIYFGYVIIVVMRVVYWLYVDGYILDLPVLSYSFPTRRSADFRFRHLGPQSMPGVVSGPLRLPVHYHLRAIKGGRLSGVHVPCMILHVANRRGCNCSRTDATPSC